VTLKDLIVLTADLDAKLGIGTVLRRAAALRIRELSSDVIRHDRRDNGVFREAPEQLRSQLRNYSFAVVICDREGCGREPLTRKQIEENLETRLQANGWVDRACAIVIDPELEAWLWGDRNALAAVIGWMEGAEHLDGWLAERRLVGSSAGKPTRLKETLRRVLMQTHKRHSPTIFQEMAQRADTATCQDPAFAKLLSTLRRWFPMA
jgi:hypothetical protein